MSSSQKATVATGMVAELRYYLQLGYLPLPAREHSSRLQDLTAKTTDNTCDMLGPYPLRSYQLDSISCVRPCGGSFVVRSVGRAILGGALSRQSRRHRHIDRPIRPPETGHRARKTRPDLVSIQTSIHEFVGQCWHQTMAIGDCKQKTH